MTLTLTRPEKSARKAKGDGHLRRAEILRAAERIFVAEGYEGATIRKIADEVGVSSTALYMHFRTRTRSCWRFAIGRWANCWPATQHLDARPGDPVDRVRGMLEAYVRFALENPNAYRLMFCAAAMEHSPRRRLATMQLGSQCFDRLAGVVGEIAAARPLTDR